MGLYFSMTLRTNSSSANSILLPLDFHVMPLSTYLLSLSAFSGVSMTMSVKNDSYDM